MKIGIADNTTLKFCSDLKKHWEEKHEVRYEIGASEYIFEWADIYYIEWWDNNLYYLFDWHKKHPTAKKPKIAVRAIDWDIWTRGIRSQEMVDWVDYIICIAPHMEDWLTNEKDDSTGQLINWNDKLYLIRPGVNLDRFTPKKNKTNGYQVGMVLSDMWWYKNHMGGLDIFATLAKKSYAWHLHIRGQHEAGQFNPVMYEHYLKSRKIEDRVTLYPPQENMNEWYEKIDYLLHPGMKEAFCYAIAEAMAKGIPVIANNFYGATDIWPRSILYNTHEQAIKMFDEVNDVDGRAYIEQRYSNERMFQEFDNLLEL